MHNLAMSPTNRDTAGYIMRRKSCPCGNFREHGTALIMSLVILLILTLLGITAMGTASLEEKMSGNTQEGIRAFQVAESGLRQSLSNSSLFTLAGSAPATYALNGRVAQVTNTYLQTTAPPRGMGYDNTFDAYHFQQMSVVNASVDSANAGLNTTITRGVAQIANKTN